MKVLKTLILSSVVVLSACNSTPEAKEKVTTTIHQETPEVKKQAPVKKTSGNEVAQNIKLEQFDKIMREIKPILVDVRTPQEFKQGHIDGAININVMDPSFKDEMAKLDAKNKPLMLYCRSGNRSGRAMRILKNEGYTNMYNLLGGYMGYTKNRK